MARPLVRPEAGPTATTGTGRFEFLNPSLGCGKWPSVSLTASQTQLFTASVSGATNTAVTWSISPNVGSISSGLYTAPSSITSSQTVTVTATSAADSTKWASATVTLMPNTTSGSAIRVNAGGSAYTDPQGNVWSADTGYGGGSAFSTNATISDTSAPTLYQTARWQSGTLQYQFAVPNGSYNIRLKFAELWFTSSGQRKFNILINGQSVLTNFDIIAAAGDAFKAIDQSFTASVTNGQIIIALTTVTQNPQINAIEIASAQVPISMSPSTATLTTGQTQQFTATSTAVSWSISPVLGTISASGLYTAPAFIASAETVTVQATSNTDPTNSATATVALQPASGTSLPVRINAGGSTYTDPQGQTWSADSSYSGGMAYSTTHAIAGTTTPTLYQTQHWNNQPFQYQFTVPNGDYTVKLKFAEIYFLQAGSRKFDIVLNSQTMQANFDVFAAAGAAYTAVDRDFPVAVTNGQIVIQFVPVVNNPIVNGIEITAASAAVDVAVNPATALLNAGQTQQFTATVTGTTNTAVTWSLSPETGTISPTGLYAAPSSVTATQTVNVKATSVADPTKSATATVTLLPVSGVSTLRINTGGGAYTDTQGNAWSADTGYNGGSSYSNTHAISGTTTPELYQTGRWSASLLKYQFAVPNGNYTVKLKFAEIFFTTAGSRKFNVNLNNQAVLTSFDSLAAAGAAYTAVDREFPVQVTDGQIVVQFVPVVNNPMINAIEITPAIAVAVNPATATLRAGQTQQFTASVTGAASSAVSWSLSPSVGSVSAAGLYTAPSSISTTQTVTLMAASLADPTKTGTATITLQPSLGTIRVNAGGSEYTDPQGNLWSADTGYSGGSAYSTTVNVAGTTTPTLYQTERWCSSAFQYQFTVPNGTYNVKLKFAELYFNRIGSRKFNVAINNQPVLSGFDIMAVTGTAFTAVDREFPISVNSGQIVIQFTSVVNNPQINAIEIQPVP